MIDALAMGRALLSIGAVLALLVLLAWAIRKGSLQSALWKPRADISIETASSLGDRRSLAIVNVEGRRLLLGLTPATVSFIADLRPRPEPVDNGAPGAPAQAGAPSARFVRDGVERAERGVWGPASDRAGVWGGAPPEK